MVFLIGGLVASFLLTLLSLILAVWLHEEVFSLKLTAECLPPKTELKTQSQLEEANLYSDLAMGFSITLFLIVAIPEVAWLSFVCPCDGRFDKMNAFTEYG